MSSPRQSLGSDQGAPRTVERIGGGEGSRESHIRAPLPRRRGNSFYRDKRDFSIYARTVCGAPVTDRAAALIAEVRA